ncbi:uncharacterized protein LOC143036850 [Oratosquilla oratoria]|uniref:uncharacterized protein LOC143036850 n=1 Tax=Oratosquilla oratoria TaxID=337810 RepID=UPI003F75CFF0
MADAEADTSEAYQKYIGSKKFSSFEEFEVQFKAFQKETGSVFRTKSSSLVAQENKRRKTPIPDAIKYGSITYCCVHYGQPKCRGQGVRPKQRYLPCGCEVLIRLSYSCGSLVVTQANLQHNHSLDHTSASFYAANRRLSSKERDSLQDVIQTLNPCTKELKDYVKLKYDKELTPKDISNLKSKLKARQLNCDIVSLAVSHIDKEKETERTKLRCTVTANRRYKEAQEVTKRLAFVMTTSDISLFHPRLQLLSELLSSWETDSDWESADIRDTKDSPGDDVHDQGSAAGELLENKDFVNGNCNPERMDENFGKSYKRRKRQKIKCKNLKPSVQDVIYKS